MFMLRIFKVGKKMFEKYDVEQVVHFLKEYFFDYLPRWKIRLDHY